MKTPYKHWFAAVAFSFISYYANAADYTMRLSHQYPPNHQVAKALDRFAEEVELQTGGKVEVEIFGAEQLFKGSQNHAAVARGEIESAAILSYQWGSTIPEMAAMSIPFLMGSSERLHKFPTSPAAELLNAKMAEKGVLNVGWLLDDNYAIFTSAKKPLIAPQDFQGLKIRGQSKLTDTGLIAMGASPSTMPGGEVYQALLTGVIDAGYTGVGAAYSRRYYEAQKFGAVGPLTTVYSNLVMNPRWWKSLPNDIRQAINVAAEHAESSLMPNSDDILPQSVADLRAAGMNVTVLDAQQQKVLRDVMQPPVIKAFEESSDDGAKLIALIQKL